MELSDAVVAVIADFAAFLDDRMPECSVRFEPATGFIVSKMHGFNAVIASEVRVEGRDDWFDVTIDTKYPEVVALMKEYSKSDQLASHPHASGLRLTYWGWEQLRVHNYPVMPH